MLTALVGGLDAAYNILFAKVKVILYFWRRSAISSVTYPSASGGGGARKVSTLRGRSDSLSLTELQASNIHQYPQNIAINIIIRVVNFLA